VTVANDDAGMITLTVTASDESEEAGDDDDLFIDIDSDRDVSTGWDEDGADYRIAAGISSSYLEGVYLGRWSEQLADFIEVPTAKIRASARANVFRFTLDRHLVGDTDSFRFTVQLWEVTSFGGVSSELAPDSGTWAFAVSIALGRLRPVLSTRSSVSGGMLVARMRLRVGRSRDFLASGRVVCGARVGGVRLPVITRDFAARRAVCRWRVPPWATGRFARGRIGVFVTRARTSFVGRDFRVRIR
jgi:hypothetical protein